MFTRAFSRLMTRPSYGKMSRNFQFNPQQQLQQSVVFQPMFSTSYLTTPLFHSFSTEANEEVVIPPKPKRALTVYTAFMKEQLLIERQNNPDAPMKEIFSKVAVQYRNLNDFSKAKYQAVSEADTQRYLQEFAA